MNSLFAHLEANLPALKALEQTAVGINATRPANSQPITGTVAGGQDPMLTAAKSAWAFLVANAPELEAIADVIASAAGAPAAVPIINAAGTALPVVGKAIDDLIAGHNTNSQSLFTSHINTASLADNVSKLGAVVAELAGAVGGGQQVTNVATEVSAVAAKIAQASDSSSKEVQSSAISVSQELPAGAIA